MFDRRDGKGLPSGTSIAIWTPRDGGNAFEKSRHQLDRILRPISKANATILLSVVSWSVPLCFVCYNDRMKWDVHSAEVRQRVPYRFSCRDGIDLIVLR